MAEVQWIKLMTDMFDNRKIRQIECLPEGDAIVVIWVKLLCLAGTVNDNGSIYITETVPYTDQMLAAQFNKPIATVQLALGILKQFGMIEFEDNLLKISNWSEYQNVEGMDRIKEQNRLRKQKERERKKLLLSSNSDVSRDCHVTVTQSHATKEKKRKKKKKEEGEEDNNRVQIDYQHIVDCYNSICISFPKVNSLSDARRKAIRARLNTHTVDDLIEAFKKAEASDFMRGSNNRNWSANFDWIMKDANLVKILDGNYDNEGVKRQQAPEEMDEGMAGFLKKLEEAGR